MEHLAHSFPKPFSNYNNSACADVDGHQEHLRAASIVNKHSNLMELILEWLENEQASVWIGAALSDDTDEPIGIAIVLSEQKKDLHQIYIDYSEVNKVYDIPSLGDYTYIVEGKTRGETPRIKVRDKDFSAAIGFDTEELFDFDLQAPLLSAEQALRYSLSYALSGNGEATFEKLSKERSDDMELSDTPYRNTQLYWVSFFYRWEENIGGVIPGFGNYIYFK